jgi:PAS domain-containing protein
VRVHATRPNGKRVAFDVTAVPLVDPASGRLAGAATTFADVTRRLQLEAEAQVQRGDLDALAAAHARELKHAHAMLERSARFCRAITDAIPAQVAYWERGAICRFANRDFLAWVGKSPDSPLGQSRLDLYGADHEAAVQQRVQSALSGKAERFSMTLQAADGRRGDFRMLFVPARGASGVVHGLYSIAYDVGACRS